MATETVAAPISNSRSRDDEILGLTTHLRINRHISSYTVFDNLLSQHYQQVLGYPGLPFTFRTGMQFSWGGDATH